MPSSRGRFVWYELMTSDAPAATAFYRKVVGWGVQEMPMPGMTYTMLTVGDAPVSGLMPIPEEARKMGARPGWIGYIAVDDVDAAAEKAKRLGGSVHRAPADIPGVGRFAIAADPQGATFALFSPTASAQQPPAGAMGEVGRAGWHELYASDWPKAFDFYSAMFGWTKDQAMDMGEMGTYQTFAHDGQMVGGMFNKPPNVPANFWAYYFGVDNIDAAAARVKDGGGQVVMGPMEVPGGTWVLQATDPQGALFALMGPKG